MTMTAPLIPGHPSHPLPGLLPAEIPISLPSSAPTSPTPDEAVVSGGVLKVKQHPHLPLPSTSTIYHDDILINVNDAILEHLEHMASSCNPSEPGVTRPRAHPGGASPCPRVPLLSLPVLLTAPSRSRTYRYRSPPIRYKDFLLYTPLATRAAQQAANAKRAAKSRAQRAAQSTGRKVTGLGGPPHDRWTSQTASLLAIKRSIRCEHPVQVLS